MEKTYLRAVEADQWQARQDLADTIPDSFDREVMASLPALTGPSGLPLLPGAPGLSALPAQYALPGQYGLPDQSIVPGMMDEPEKSAEWSSMLQMIGNASGVLWQKDAEVESLKTQIELQRKAMLDECQILQAELKEARDETLRANSAAALANTRAIKAETWLQQVKEALASGFAPHLGKAQADRTGTPAP